MELHARHLWTALLLGLAPVAGAAWAGGTPSIDAGRHVRCPASASEVNAGAVSTLGTPTAEASAPAGPIAQVVAQRITHGAAPVPGTSFGQPAMRQMVAQESGSSAGSGTAADPPTRTTEYAISGNIHLSAPSSQDLTLRWAPFLNPHIQYGVELTADHVSHSRIFGNVGALANYYFKALGTARTLPYAGLSLGTSYGFAHNDIAYGAQAGIKQFLNRNVALFAELQWLHSGGSNPVDLNFGISVFR